MLPRPLRHPLLALAAAVLGLCLSPCDSLAACAPPGQEFRVNTATEGVQQSSSVAMTAKGDFVIAWQSEIAGSGDEIRARRFDACGLPRSGEIAVNRVTAGNQNAPAVAASGNGFVVVWQSLVASNYVIRARRFDDHGMALGDDIAVDTRPRDLHGAPAVVMHESGSFVVVWESSVHGSFEIRARRFDANGVAQGGEIAVNASSASSQRVPAVAMDRAGNFVVTWRSNVNGSFEIQAQRFDARGVAQGPELAVNSVQVGDQLAPAVAMAAGGDFVIAWENSYDRGFEIRARRFDAAGVAKDAELTVSPATAGNQFAPALAMTPGGDLIVSWHGLIGDGYDIRARAFGADGAALADEQAINTATPGTQRSAAVTLNAERDFVVAWHSDADGSWDVAARRERLPRASTAPR
ncbi:MAG: hypothetical protein ABW217_10850 [Polyangiaceae bacterium]